MLTSFQSSHPQRPASLQYALLSDERNGPGISCTHSRVYTSSEDSGTCRHHSPIHRGSTSPCLLLTAPSRGSVSHRTSTPLDREPAYGRRSGHRHSGPYGPCSSGQGDERYMSWRHISPPGGLRSPVAEDPWERGSCLQG